MPDPTKTTERASAPTPKRREIVLTEEEVDLIDALRAARSGECGKPFEQILREHGYSLES